MIWAFDGGTSTSNLGQTQYFWDSHNRLKTVIVDLDASTTARSDYGYDLNGVLTWQRDPNLRVTTHTVNTWGLHEVTTEASTTAHPAPADREFVQIYEEDGLIEQRREPGGVIVRYLYDSLGRVTSETGNDGFYRQFKYDAYGRVEEVNSYGGTIDYVYDDRGLLLESEHSSGDVSYTYDGDSRLTHRLEEGVVGAHAFGWTAQNELKTHNDPITGTIAQYTWNDASQVTQIGQAGSTRTIDYTPAGDLWKDTWKRGGNGGTEIRHQSTYTYDLRGDILTESRQLRGLGTKDHAFTYNRGGRLTDWDVTNGATIEEDVAYHYDKAGNRLRRDNTDSSSDYWTYDERNQVLTGPGTVYVWDARGTLDRQTVDGQLANYSFDALGRLRSVTDPGGNIIYRYDGHDRLVRRVQAGITQQFAYAGASQEPHHSNDGTIDIRYGRSPSGRLTSLNDQTGNTRIAGLNRHGDLQWLATGDGNDLEQAITYTPYGETHETWGSDPTPELGYQSDYTDPDTTNVLMQARWYSPNSGTFKSRDTYAGDLNTPISLNRFTYAHNNPTRYWDPTGREPCAAGGGGGCYYGDGGWLWGDINGDGQVSPEERQTQILLDAINGTLSADEQAAIAGLAADLMAQPDLGFLLELETYSQAIDVCRDDPSCTDDMLRALGVAFNAAQNAWGLSYDGCWLVENGPYQLGGQSWCGQSQTGLAGLWEVVIDVALGAACVGAFAAATAGAPATSGTSYAGAVVGCGALAAVGAGIIGNLLAGRAWNDGILQDAIIGGLSAGVFEGLATGIKEVRRIRNADSLAPRALFEADDLALGTDWGGELGVWSKERGIQYYNSVIDAYPGMPFSELSDMIDDVVASGNRIHFNLEGLSSPSPAQIVAQGDDFGLGFTARELRYVCGNPTIRAATTFHGGVAPC